MTQNKQSNFQSAYSMIKGQLDRLPLSGKAKEKVMTKLNELKELTIEAREPRIALIGRRGTGKSSLINALFGEDRQFVSSVRAGTQRGKWLWYPDEDQRRIRLLDSRGLGESEEFEMGSYNVPINQLKEELEAEQPDVLLFLIKAKEVDARVDEDLKELNELRTFIKDVHDYEVPVICVITQVDELDPPYYKEVPLDGHPEKAENIQTATRFMEKKLIENDIPLLTIFPTCTYVHFDKDGQILYDMRWNIEEFASYLVDSLPNDAKLKTAKATKANAAKKKVAQKVVTTMAGIASLIALEPIPFADMPILTSLQALMIIVIAYISGRKINRTTAAEFIGAVGANVGLAFAVREGVRSVVKFIPAAGNVISGAVAGGVTYGIGQAGIAYFIDGMDMKKTKRTYERSRKKFREDRE